MSGKAEEPGCSKKGCCSKDMEGQEFARLELLEIQSKSGSSDWMTESASRGKCLILDWQKIDFLGLVVKYQGQIVVVQARAQNLLEKSRNYHSLSSPEIDRKRQCMHVHLWGSVKNPASHHFVHAQQLFFSFCPPDSCAVCESISNSERNTFQIILFDDTISEIVQYRPSILGIVYAVLGSTGVRAAPARPEITAFQF